MKSIGLIKTVSSSFLVAVTVFASLVVQAKPVELNINLATPVMEAEKAHDAIGLLIDEVLINPFSLM